MSLKTATSQIEGQSIIRVFHFADIDDGDTFVGPAAPKSYWIENHTDGVAVSATESAGTYTFTVASSGSNKVVDLFILL